MSDVVKWDELTTWKRGALVAEKVMGWTSTWDRDWDNPRNGDKCLLVDEPYHRYFMPTADIGDAWEVVEKMKPHGDSIWWMVKDTGPGAEGAFWSDTEGAWVRGYAATAPEAICIAALRACGVEVLT